MPAELDEILAEWRTASGPHIVQASEMRRMAAEVDRLQTELRRAILTDSPMRVEIGGVVVERGRVASRSHGQEPVGGPATLTSEELDAWAAEIIGEADDGR